MPGRVPKRTHRVVQRIGKIHERVDRVLQSSLGQTRDSREKAMDATLSKSTRKRNTSSCQEPDRSREEWPVPAGTVMAECKAVTAQAQATWRAGRSGDVWMSRHMERLAALRRRRRRLSRARRPAPAASAGWATAAAATLGGARPCASRRASQSLSESDATSGTREASEACAGAGASGASPEGRGVPEAAANARETRERRS